MKLLCCAVTAWAALCLSISLNSQQSDTAPPSPDLILHTTVTRVVEDVIVTDAHGNPIRGLTKSDFSIKEDNKPQTILFFEAHDGSKPDFVPPKIPPLPANTFVDLPSAPEQGPLLIILYDIVNMDLPDQVYAREALLKFIDSKAPGTRTAIFVNTDETRLVQGFTQDKVLLLAALLPHHVPHVPNIFLYGENYGKGNEGATLSLFQQLAQYLDGIPGRKNLIWLSGKFPLDLLAEPNSPIGLDDVKETVAGLTRDRIAIYPVDARGVLIDGGGGGGSAITGAGMSAAPGQYMGLDALAQTTGGHAYYSNNNIVDMLDKAVSYGSSYYTLSYAPSNRNENGAQRTIAIRVKGVNYDLGYRRYYYAIPVPIEQPGPMTGSDMLDAHRQAPHQNETLDTLYAGIEHGSPMQHDLLFSAHVQTKGQPLLATAQQMAQIQDEPAFFRSRRKHGPAATMRPIRLQKFLIDYRVVDPELKIIAARTGRKPMLEFAAAAYSADGTLLNGVTNDAFATIPAKRVSAQPAFFRVEQEIDLPLQTAWLRLAVRDSLTDSMGTIELAVPLKPEFQPPSSQ